VSRLFGDLSRRLSGIMTEQGSPNIARTALRLLPLQAALRAGEAFLPIALAAWFGRGAATDLYYLLAAYYVFAAALLTGAFQDSGAVAVLIDVGTRKPGELPEVAGALLGHTLAIAVGLGLTMGVLAGVVFGLTSFSRELALELVALMSLGLVATAVRAFYVGFLNSRGAFRAHPIASGLGMVVTWGLLAWGQRDLGVRMIPAAMFAGELVAIAVLRGLTHRGLGVRIVPSLKRSEPVRRILSLVRLETTGTIITRINPMVDQLMSGLAGVVGGGTLVRYAGDVAALPTSILQATVFPVLLSRLAHEAQRPTHFGETTRRTLYGVTTLLVLAALLVASLRRPLCVLLFAHGAMDRAGVDRMTDMLPWALVGVPPFGALLVLARAHVALQNSRIMPSMGVLNATLNLGLNALFVRFLGLSGLLLSTSVTYAVVAAVFWVRLPPSVRLAQR
jgi:putative peptidoglycan lipid II flippase